MGCQFCVGSVNVWKFEFWIWVYPVVEKNFFFLGLGDSNCEIFKGWFFEKGLCVLCCFWIWILNCCFIDLFLWNIFLFGCSMLRCFSVYQCLVFVLKPTLWEIWVIWTRLAVKISFVVIVHTHKKKMIMITNDGCTCFLVGHFSRDFVVFVTCLVHEGVSLLWLFWYDSYRVSLFQVLVICSILEYLQHSFASLIN